MPEESYPWEEIRRRYEARESTIAEMSREYGFNERYGYKKANRNDWDKGLVVSEIHRDAAKKVREEQTEKEANLRSTYDEIMRRIRDETVAELLDSATDFDRLKQLKISTQILSNTRSEQWEVNLFEEAADELELDFTGEVEHRGDIDVNHDGQAAEAIIRAIEANRSREGDDPEGSE